MLWTLIPAKSFQKSKQRLATILSEHDRAELGRAMLTHTIAVAKAAFGSQPVLVVADGDDVATVAKAAGADRCIIATSHGLNPQLAEAAAEVPHTYALLVLHADLPLLEPADLKVLISREGAVVMAPDAAGEGTNALLQRAARRFFAFGVGSRARHEAEAQRLGLDITLVRQSGLSHDLDDANDWQALGERLCQQGRSLTFQKLLTHLRSPLTAG